VNTGRLTFRSLRMGCDVYGFVFTKKAGFREEFSLGGMKREVKEVIRLF
jgi:hypothetical protein